MSESLRSIAVLGTDPAVRLSLAWGLATVFAIGLWHKVQAPAAFLATLRQYRVLPAPLHAPAAILVVLMEAILVLALLVAAQRTIVGWAAVAVLGLYSVAIAINLVRGRRDIDCGCSGPALRQTLSGALLWRNGALMGLAGALCLEGQARELYWLDVCVALAFAASVLLLYTASNQLIANAPRLAGMFAR